jgi:hypothetical protein
MYLLNTDEYRKLIQSGRNENIASGDVGIDGGQLLIQSGGAQASEPTAGQAKINRTRNPYFKLDYYIDSLSIKNVLPGKGTGMASASTNLKMTIIEPNGISLIDNLITNKRQFLQELQQLDALVEKLRSILTPD